MSKTAANRRKQIASARYRAYRGFFTSDDGKEVLKDMMQACYFRDSIIGKDPYETYYKEGARSVVLRILSTAKMSNEEVNKILDTITQEQNTYFDEL